MVNILVQDEDVREPWTVLLNNKQTVWTKALVWELMSRLSEDLQQDVSRPSVGHSKILGQS